MHFRIIAERISVSVANTKREDRFTDGIFLLREKQKSNNIRRKIIVQFTRLMKGPPLKNERFEYDR